MSEESSLEPSLQEGEVKISDVRVDGDSILIVVEWNYKGRTDSFGRTIPISEFESMEESQLIETIKNWIKERRQLLDEVERQEEEKRKREKALEKTLTMLKTKKFKVEPHELEQHPKPV